MPLSLGMAQAALNALGHVVPAAQFRPIAADHQQLRQAQAQITKAKAGRRLTPRVFGPKPDLGAEEYPREVKQWPNTDRLNGIGRHNGAL